MHTSIKIIVALILMAAGIFSCGEKKAEPSIPVTFEQVVTPAFDPVMEKGLSVGKRVSLTGYMGLTGVMSLQTDTLLVHLFSEEGRNGKKINLSVKIGSSGNQIEQLPSNYTFDDLKARAADGKVVTSKTKVRVHGERLGQGNEAYINVDRIEAI